MKVYCDECGHEFKPMLRTRLGREYDRVFFRCPECKSEFNIMFQCEEMKEAIEKKKKTTIDSHEYTVLQNKIDKLNEYNKRDYERREKNE